MARIARRSLRIANLPLFSLQRPWQEVMDAEGTLPLNLFEPRYVELARKIERPNGSQQFGYTDVSQRRKSGRGVLLQAGDMRWMSRGGPVQLVASGLQRFRILSLQSETVGKHLPPLSLAHVQLLVDADLARVPAEHHGSGSGDRGQGPPTIFGQVYAHTGGGGVASYHFDEAGAYISYENALSSVFPALDDGTRPPARKFFENPAYDPTTRTFRGHVTWIPSWMGAHCWEYEMIFSSDLNKIVGGFVKATLVADSNGARERITRFGVDLYYQKLSVGVEGTPEGVKNVLLQSGIAPAAVEASLKTALTDENGPETVTQHQTRHNVARRPTAHQRRQIRWAVTRARGVGPEGSCLVAVETLAKLSCLPCALQAAEEALLDILQTAADSSSQRALVEAALWKCWGQSENAEIEALYADGKQLMQQERLPDALATFGKLVDMAPEFAEAWSKRAMVLHTLGRHEEAIQDCKQALALKPRHFGCLALQGVCHMALGDKAEALSCLHSALAVHPNMQGVKQLLDQSEVQQLVEIHLNPRIKNMVASYEQQGWLPPSTTQPCEFCSWEVYPVKLDSEEKGWAYFFRAHICNPSSSEHDIKNCARFYILRATDGKVFSFTKPTLGDEAVRLAPGEEHKFCWVLLVGREMQDMAAGVLLQQGPGILVEDFPSLVMLGARDIDSPELEQLAEGYVFTGQLDLRSAAEF